MSRKSLLIQAKIELVKAAHDCQANHGRRLVKGEVRLAIRNGRSWDNYCRECAEKIIARSMEKLTKLHTMTPESDASED